MNATNETPCPQQPMQEGKRADQIRVGGGWKGENTLFHSIDESLELRTGCDDLRCGSVEGFKGTKGHTQLESLRLESLAHPGEVLDAIPQCSTTFLEE